MEAQEVVSELSPMPADSTAERNRRGGARPGAGRKKGVVSARRMRRCVAVRLQDDEAAALSVAASEAGMKTGRFVRSLVHERLRGVRTVLDVRERKLLAELLGELRRQGSNLNQIAFALNCLTAGIELSSGAARPAGSAVATAADEVRRTAERLRDILALESQA